MLVRVTRTVRCTQTILLDIPDREHDKKFPSIGAPHRAVKYVEAAEEAGVSLAWSTPKIIPGSDSVKAFPAIDEPDPSETELLAEAPPSYSPAYYLDPL